MQVNSMLFSLPFGPFPSSLSLLSHFQNCSNVSAKNLQQQLDMLEGDCLTWRAQTEDHERALTRSLEFCITRDEIGEVGTHTHTHTHVRAHTCTHTHNKSGDFLFTLDLLIYQAVASGLRKVEYRVHFKLPKLLISVCCQCIDPGM